MKLIRAVLRHSLLIAIVVAAGLAYYYRDELLPKFYEKLAEYRGAPEESEPAKTPTSEQGVEVEEEIVLTAPEPQPPAAPLIKEEKNASLPCWKVDGFCCPLLT